MSEATVKHCSQCPEDMRVRMDVTGNDTHEWQCWRWECDWCGHALAWHDRKAGKWEVQP